MHARNGFSLRNVLGFGRRDSTEEISDADARTRFFQVDKNHFEALDGLRGIAAITVLVGHITALILGYSLVARKHLAVQFFFMLSGFVIAHAYDGRLKKGMSVTEFFTRRVIRLYPLIFIGTLLGTIFFAIFDAHFMSASKNFTCVLLAALVLPSTGNFGFGYFPINPPEWSLFYEFLAYALFVFFIAKCSPRNLVIAILISFGLFCYVTLSFGTPPFWTQTFAASAPFCIGVWLCRANRRGQLFNYKIPFAILAIALLFTWILPDQFGPGVDIVSTIFIYPCVIAAGAAHMQTPKGAFTRFLGELSYPLYILHWPIVLFTKRIFLKSLGQMETCAFACVNAIVISWIVLVLIDRPIRKRLTERFINPQTPDALLQTRVDGSFPS